MRKNKEEIKEDNILHINEKILKYFETEKKRVRLYEHVIEQLLKKLKLTKCPYGIESSITYSINNFVNEYNVDINNSGNPSSGQGTLKIETNLTYKEYKDIYTQISNIHKHINDIYMNEMAYTTNVLQYIEKYTNIINQPKTIQFIGKKVESENQPLLQVISDFNNLVKTMIDNKTLLYYPVIPDYFISKKEKDETEKFVNSIKNSIKNIVKKQKINICKCINKDENKIEQTVENGCQIVCGECGMVYNSNFTDNVTFYDYSRVNMTQKYHYEKKCHFRDTINQYQGKQNKHIPQSVYDNLEKMLEMHGLLNKDDSGSKYEKVTKQHIRTFLKEIEKSKYYEDTQLIFSQLTGKSKPDISKYEKELYDDFDKLVKVFVSIKGISCYRKNFLNSHYVLRQLLLKQGIRVPYSDLNTLKTHSRLREHDEIYKQCCELLNWEFHPMC
jgi:hypothetical protein